MFLTNNSMISGDKKTNKVRLNRIWVAKVACYKYPHMKYWLLAHNTNRGGYTHFLILVPITPLLLKMPGYPGGLFK